MHLSYLGASLVAQFGKESSCQCRKCGFDSLGQEGSLGEGNGNPLQYFCLGNTMDRGVWQATAHGVARVGHDGVSKHMCKHM